MSADTKGRRDRIEIVVGDAPEAHVTRIIDAPRRVWLDESAEPAREAIEVESDDGVTTIVQFQRVPPEHGERQLPGAS